MPDLKFARMHTLARRELQESRNSLLWTPVVITIGLVLIMLVSVVLSSRISVIGDTLLRVLVDEEASRNVNISINIDRENGRDHTSYTIEKNGAVVDEDEWDFSRDWEFEPRTGLELQDELQREMDERVENLNPVLNMVHNVLILVLLMVSFSYLLASLFNDRKDRSILFWRSLPMSEWEEVLSKLGIALVVAPAIFIAASLLIQMAYVLIAMGQVWRMDMDPFRFILGNIEFGSLLFNQIAGWLLTALWIAPIYAWLLLASAAARRSPFFVAVAPVAALMVIERVFLGTQHLFTAVGNHIPHYAEGANSLGFYIYGPDWAALNYPGMLLGLVFTAVALTAAVYLRRYHFEM